MIRIVVSYVLLVCVATCVGCGGRRGEKEVPSIEVCNVEEFLEAIGSDRVLVLAPGQYVLSEVKDRQMDFVRWDPNFDGKTLTIRNVKGLKIVGKGEKPVRLVVRPRYVFVLHFEDCEDVQIVNLAMGHAPEEGGCDSGVLGATSCEGLIVRKCDLFGCGTEGLTLKNIRSFTFEDSCIRDCTYGIMTARGCEGLAFERSRFTKNREFWGVRLHDTKGVAFVDCVFSGNKCEEALFQATSCSNVVVKGGELTLTNNQDAVSFEKE